MNLIGPRGRHRYARIWRIARRSLFLSDHGHGEIALRFASLLASDAHLSSTSALAIEDSRFVLDVCVLRALPLRSHHVRCGGRSESLCGRLRRPAPPSTRSTPQVPPLASPPPLAPASSPLTNVSVPPTRSPASPLHPAQLLVEPRIEPSIEPGVKPSIEPGVKPSVEPSVEPRVEPRVEPHEPHELSAAEPCKPRAAEPRELCASKSERARSRARE